MSIKTGRSPLRASIYHGTINSLGRGITPFTPFNPASLYDAYPTVYGDYFRSDLSPIQQSGGNMTLWPGLRATGDLPDANAAFDITPAFGTNSAVGTNGPSGSGSVAMNNFAHSRGRGGSATTYPPSPFNATTPASGYTFGGAIYKGGGIAAKVQDTDYNGGRIILNSSATVTFLQATFYDESYGSHSITSDTGMVPSLDDAPGYFAYCIRIVGQIVTLFVSNGTTVWSGSHATEINSETLTRWLGFGGPEYFGYFRQHRAMSNAECEQMLGWLAAGFAP